MTAITRQTNLLEGSAPSVTWENASTTSAALFVGDYNGGTFAIPSAISGASVTIEGSVDGTNWGTIHDNDNADIAAITIAANGQYRIPDEAFNYPHIRFSGTSQGAERTLQVFLKG